MENNPNYAGARLLVRPSTSVGSSTSVGPSTFVGHSTSVGNFTSAKHATYAEHSTSAEHPTSAVHPVSAVPPFSVEPLLVRSHSSNYHIGPYPSVVQNVRLKDPLVGLGFTDARLPSGLYIKKEDRLNFTPVPPNTIYRVLISTPDFYILGILDRKHKYDAIYAIHLGTFCRVKIPPPGIHGAEVMHPVEEGELYDFRQFQMISRKRNKQPPVIKAIKRRP